MAFTVLIKYDYPKDIVSFVATVKYVIKLHILIFDSVDTTLTICNASCLRLGVVNLSGVCY